MLAFEPLEHHIEAFRRLNQRALRWNTSEKVEYAMRFYRRTTGFQHVVEQLSGTLAGFRHVDVRICPVRDQAVAMLDHRARDVGVQIEARDERNPSTDNATHAREELALAVVQVLGYHRPVQVQIDAVDGSEFGQAP